MRQVGKSVMWTKMDNIVIMCNIIIYCKIDKSDVWLPVINNIRDN